MPAGKIINRNSTINNIYYFGIGINEYKESQLNLRGCVRDIEDFSNALSPYKEILLINEKATYKNIFAQITEYITDYNLKLKKGDFLIISVSGHGHIVNKDLAIVVHETERFNLLGTTLSTFYLMTALSDISANGCKILIILDICKAGSLNFDLSKYSGLLSGGGISAIYACGSSENAKEKPYMDGVRGVFAKHLLDGLNGNADFEELNIITLRNLYDYVYKNVCKEFPDQHPALIGTLEGDTVLKVL